MLLMKNPLGYKSMRKIIILLLVVLISLLMALVFHLSNWNQNYLAEISFIGASFLCVGFASLIALIPILFQPRVPIQYDDKGLYIFYNHKQPVFVKYSLILNVVVAKKYNQIKKDQNGSIVITTISGDLCIEDIKDVAKVREKILEFKENKR